MNNVITGMKLSKPKIWLNTLGDCWNTVWAEDDKLYAVADDCAGVADSDNDIADLIDNEKDIISNINSPPWANFAVNELWWNEVGQIRGTTINRMIEYGNAGIITPKGCSDGCCWKAMGITSVDNVLYITVGRHDYGSYSGDYKFRQKSENAIIIKSTDSGKTWTPSANDNYRSPMFKGGKFGTPFFIHYGKAGTETVHNSNLYVYAVSNNGFWDNGDHMRLGRVLKTKIGDLCPFDWEYYVSGDGMTDENWTKNINESSLILKEPGKCSMTGATYIEGLGRYIMIQWYYTSGSGQSNEAAANNGLLNPGQETTWDFYESPYPWGEWRKFHSHTFNPLGAYNPCIVTKSIRDGGTAFTVFTNGNFHIGQNRGVDCLYRLHSVECEIILG